MSAPAVSICVPTYNGARYLAQTLESIERQSHSDFEVLVVDDGSTDATLELCGAYARRDPRVRLVRNERNRGLVGNWNRCVELARGRWIKFVFQDDLIRPDALSRLVDVAERTAAPMAFGRRDFLFEDGTSAEARERYEAAAQRIADLFPEEGLTDARTFSRLVLAHTMRNIVGEPVAVLLRRDVFDAVGTFNPHIAVFCDMEFWMRVGTRFGVAHTPETVADFRVHDASTTARTLTSNHFQMFVLDPLVVQHDLAYQPAYEGIRAVACEEGIDLSARFVAAARWARGEARRLSQQNNAAAEGPLADLEALQQALPHLRAAWGPAKQQGAAEQFLTWARRVFLGSTP